MITLRDATLRRGTKVLFQHANLTVHRGQKVGVVGRNGSGKSSLFDAIRAEASVDEGELEVPRELQIASLRQEVPSSSLPAIEFVKDGDEELRRIERAIAGAESTADGARLRRRVGSFYRSPRGGVGNPYRSG